MSTLTFVSLGPEDYDRAKRVLNKAKHPGFVGRELFYRCATSGSCTLAVQGDQDIGVALVAKGKLQAMSVVAAAQGGGVGSQLLDQVKPQWVNAIMDRVPWFEKRGYAPVGAAKPGQAGKMAVQLMQRVGDVPPGELAEKPPKPEPLDESPTLQALMLEYRDDRAYGELTVLERLVRSAEIAGDFKSCISLLEEARKIWQRHGAREPEE